MARIEEDELLERGARGVVRVEHIRVLVAVAEKDDFGRQVCEVRMRVIRIPRDGGRIPLKTELAQEAADLAFRLWRRLLLPHERVGVGPRLFGR